MDKLIDRYWEVKREIFNTPPIYFFKLKRLFKELDSLNREIEQLKKKQTT